MQQSLFYFTKYRVTVTSLPVVVVVTEIKPKQGQLLHMPGFRGGTSVLTLSPRWPTSILLVQLCSTLVKDTKLDTTLSMIKF